METNFASFIKKNIGYLIAISGLGFFLYAFNLHGALFWDDADWILNNPSVHSLTWDNIKFIFSHDVLAGIGQVSNYYRPFLFLTFLTNYLIGGASSVGYHIVSNGIHILNACFIFYLLMRWLGNKRAAFLASLLFLIHPLQTEAVTYISGRGDPLSVFFILGGIILYLNKYRWLSAVAAILAVLSRETAVLFPIYLGIALIAFEERGLFLERLKKAFIKILPFIGISGLYGILRLTALNFQNTLNFYEHQNIYSEHLSYRIYTFFHALIEYIRLAFWPIKLHMDRDIPVSIHIWDSYSWLGGLLVVGLLFLLVYLYRKESGKFRNSKLEIINSSFSVWFFGLGIFFTSLLPTSGITPINARIYEHWLYFALFGFFAILVFYLDRLFIFLKKHKPKLYAPTIILFTVYCMFLGIQTIRRNLLWGNTEAFYLNILHYEPNDVRILNNLGNWYSDKGDINSATPLYERAIGLEPTQPAPYYNLGNIAKDTGQLDRAEELYKKAITANPSFHYAYGNLAQVYINQNRLAEALEILKQLQKVYPSQQTQKNIEILQKELQ